MKRIHFANNTENLILSCFEKVTLTKGNVFAPHYHLRAEIMYIVSGKIAFSIFKDTQRFSETLTENQFILFERGTPHGFEIQEENTYFWTIEFDNLKNVLPPANFSLAEAFTENAPLYSKLKKNGYAVYYDQSDLNKSISRMTDAFAESSFFQKDGNETKYAEHDYLFHVYLQEFFILISLNASMSRSSGTQYITRITSFLQRNYATNFSLNSLADTIGVNKHYMERLFKKYTGESIHRRVISLRCEKAKQLLKNSSLSVDKIAKTTGFGVRQQLIYNFKNLYGVSPYEYRLRHRDEFAKLLPNATIAEQTYDFIADP
ncbi:MAG: helix-turn-helix domain-containing protein [Candidatus Scatosoma sp.]